jgi:hypothetical protein
VFQDRERGLPDRGSIRILVCDEGCLQRRARAVHENVRLVAAAGDGEWELASLGQHRPRIALDPQEQVIL